MNVNLRHSNGPALSIIQSGLLIFAKRAALAAISTLALVAKPSPALALPDSAGSSGKKAAACPAALIKSASSGTQAPIDSSAKAGILMHGEHWVDLILAQGATTSTRHLGAYKETLEQLLVGLRAGRIQSVNEKIDGSPSIVLGFDAQNEGFVAYKGHFDSKTKQTLVTTPQIPEGQFARSPALRAIFTNLISELQAPLAHLKRKYRDFIFQGDLLFIDGDAKKVATADSISFQPNTITYAFKADHAYFTRLQKAKVAFVIHSVGERVIEADGSVRVKPVADENVVRDFVADLNGENIFALHPHKDNVVLTNSQAWRPENEEVVRGLVEQIERHLMALNSAGHKGEDEFRAKWGAIWQERFRTFFNVGLRPPNDGGVYRAVAKRESVSISDELSKFKLWLKGRKDGPKELAAFEPWALKHQVALDHLLQAYISAIRLQYALLPYLPEVLASKLGGGESEGFMLKTSDTVVKFVDRLAFTISNNIRWNRAAKPAVIEASPAPVVPPENLFSAWRPGEFFVVMKGQPIHAGHIQMIKYAAAQARGRPVYVIASEKEPNLEATKWNDLKSTETKTELAAREYEHVFSKDLRREILEAGLKDTDVRIVMTNTHRFWQYVKRANADQLPGKVTLVIGDKEIQEGRYSAELRDHQLNLESLVVPAQAGGVSGTRTREFIRQAAIGNSAEKAEAKRWLDEAYSFVAPPLARRRLINRMISEWAELDKKAQELIAIPAQRTRRRGSAGT